MLTERFWSKVDRRDLFGCWIWTGAVSSSGYGLFKPVLVADGDSPPALVHRLAYEDAVGPIEGGLTIDHLCFTPLCVNAAHLEAVTQAVNILRSNGMSARHARSTHCARGHEKSPANKLRSGECRACRNARRAKRRAAA